MQLLGDGWHVSTLVGQPHHARALDRARRSRPGMRSLPNGFSFSVTHGTNT
jgi:hypothetical protein